MRRVLVRADPQVAPVRVLLGSGERLDLPPAAARPDLGLVFFATLLPPSAVLVSVVAIDENGQVLEPQDLSHHEANWQRFLRQHGRPGAGGFRAPAGGGVGMGFTWPTSGYLATVRRP